MTVSSYPSTTRTALKEWAVACSALGRGDQILLLRKGGIREEQRDFRIEHSDFLLLPTYEHQRAELLKPAYRAALERTLAERRSPETLTFRYWAQVAAVFEITEVEQLAALSLLHLWSDDYALERLRWKPRHPLSAVALRVCALPRRVERPLLAEYGGCKSWITLADAVAVEGARAVLGDERFSEQLAAIRAALGLDRTGAGAA